MKKLFLGLFFSLMAMNTFAGNKISVSSVSVAPGQSTTVTVSADITSDNIWSMDFFVQLPDGLYIPEKNKKTEGDYDQNSFTVDATWNKDFWTQGTDFDWATAAWKKKQQAYHFSFGVDGAGVYVGSAWLVTFTVCAKSTATAKDYDITISKVEIANEDAEKDQDPTMDAAFTAATATIGSYAATFKAGGSTICAESALDFSEVSGAKLYAVTEISSTAAKLTQIEDGIADANKGYLVMGLSGDQKIPFADGSSSYTGENLLKGVTAPTAIASGAKIYVFSDGEFHPCSGGTLAAGKAYLDCSGVEGLAKTITIAFDETTGISNISSDEDASNAPIYNLSGMRVQKAQKGVYIRNGKKYVVE